MSRAILAVAVLASVFSVAGCETQAQRKKAEDAALRKQGAEEIKRICALPRAERDAEVQKIKEQSGVVLDCGGP